MYLGNIAGLIVVLTTVPLFAAILRIPFSIIAPVIVVICAIGAYTVHNAMLDVWFMLVFGVLGYCCSRSSTTRSRRWSSRWCWATRRRTRFASRCSSRRATSRFCGRTRSSEASRRSRLVMLFWPLISKALAALRRPKKLDPVLAGTEDRAGHHAVVALTQEMGSLSKDVAKHWLGTSV